MALWARREHTCTIPADQSGPQSHSAPRQSLLQVGVPLQWVTPGALALRLQAALAGPVGAEPRWWVAHQHRRALGLGLPEREAAVPWWAPSPAGGPGGAGGGYWFVWVLGVGRGWAPSLGQGLLEMGQGQGLQVGGAVAAVRDLVRGQPASGEPWNQSSRGWVAKNMENKFKDVSLKLSSFKIPGLSHRKGTPPAWHLTPTQVGQLTPYISPR